MCYYGLSLFTALMDCAIFFLAFACFFFFFFFLRTAMSLVHPASCMSNTRFPREELAAFFSIGRIRLWRCLFVTLVHGACRPYGLLLCLILLSLVSYIFPVCFYIYISLGVSYLGLVGN